MNITAIGKFLRKLRIDNSEIMKDMADKLGITPSYLSAIELGKRQIPESFVNELIDKYKLSEFEIKLLQKAVDQSAKEVVIHLDKHDPAERALAIGFARKLDSLDEKLKEQLKQLLGVDDVLEK